MKELNLLTVNVIMSRKEMRIGGAIPFLSGLCGFFGKKKRKRETNYKGNHDQAGKPLEN